MWELTVNASDCSYVFSKVNIEGKDGISGRNGHAGVYRKEQGDILVFGG